MPTVTEAQIDGIVRRLVDEFDPVRVILFGSQAWGEPTEDSDVDLLIVVDESDESLPKRASRAYACTWGFGIPMDLLVWTADETARMAESSTSMAAEILERGTRLYERGEG